MTVNQRNKIRILDTFRKLWYRITHDKNLNIANIIVAVIFGIGGTLMTCNSNKLNEQMLELSKVQIEMSKRQDSTSVSIEHFNRLLGKTDTVISELNKELYYLRMQQKVADEHARLESISNERRFFVAATHLSEKSLIVDIMAMSDETRLEYLADAEYIINSQITNPFLTSNKYLFDDWMKVSDIIANYRTNTFFWQIHPDREKMTKERNINWWNCLAAISNLGRSTTSYEQVRSKQNGRPQVNEDYVEMKKKYNFD